jgi:hypothetical protein
VHAAIAKAQRILVNSIKDFVARRLAADEPRNHPAKHALAVRLWDSQAGAIDAGDGLAAIFIVS